MYLIRRTSTVPAGPMTVQVDGAPDGSGDGGFQGGGVYYFMPAGQDGDQHQVGEHAARLIMGDPGLAKIFTCDPALPVTEPAADAGAEPAEQPDSTSGRRRRQRSGT